MTIDDILNGNDNFLKDIANQALIWKQQHDSGQLSNSEFNELMSDLVDIDKIADETNNVQKQIEIKEAFDIISQAVSFLPI